MKTDFLKALGVQLGAVIVFAGALVSLAMLASHFAPVVPL